MEFNGTETIKADRNRIFNFIIDPYNFSSGIPEIQKIDVIDPNNFRIIAKLGISFLKGQFTIDFTYKDKTNPSHVELFGHGKGMQSAFDINITVDLKEIEGGATLLIWHADTKVTGMLASLGQNMLNSIAEKLVKEIFTHIQNSIQT
jgi:carbon monoxide dehydrogenase subunit G